MKYGYDSKEGSKGNCADKGSNSINWGGALEETSQHIAERVVTDHYRRHRTRFTYLQSLSIKGSKNDNQFACFAAISAWSVYITGVGDIIFIRAIRPHKLPRSETDHFLYPVEVFGRLLWTLIAYVFHFFIDGIDIELKVFEPQSIHLPNS